MALAELQGAGAAFGATAAKGGLSGAAAFAQKWGLSSWWGELLASLAVVLSICSDDVLWLLPFAVHRQKRAFMCFYFFCMQLAVLVAWMAVDLELLLTKVVPSTVPMRSLFQWASAALLVAYTGYLFYEWKVEQDAERVGERIVLKQKDKESGAQQKKEQPRTMMQLFVICCCGSINNLAVYMVLLLTHAVTLPQLHIAVLLVSSTVAALCLCASMVRPVVSLIEGVPLWCIMMAVCAWMLGHMLYRPASVAGHAS